MAPEPLARSEPALEPTEAEYQAFCDTLMETGRGRWFLAEYARRHRAASTAAALDALKRIEGSLRGAAADPLREELRSLAATIRGARLDIGWSDSEFSKGAKVMALLELLERRINDLIERETDAPMPPEEKPETARVQLTVISATSGPLPLRGRADLPPVEIVAEPPARPAPAPEIEIHPDEMFVPFEFDAIERPEPRADSSVSIEVAIAAGPVEAKRIEPEIVAVPVEVTAPPAPVQAAPAQAAPSAYYDPLTPVMALRLEERIALVS